MTVREWGVHWLKFREVEVRSPRADRCRWSHHVEASSLADRELASLTRLDVKNWLRDLSLKFNATPYHRAKAPLSAATIQATLVTLRVALEAAKEAGYLEFNPALGVKLPPRVKARGTADKWTVLVPAEQARVRAALRGVERVMVEVAMGAGLRAGELVALTVDDVHLETDEPHIVVRFGGHGRRTKNAKMHRVQLFGMALESLDAWMVGGGRDRLLERVPHPDPRMVFPPTRRGKRGAKAVHGFARAVKAAGITRNVRWHDLRHTCASSMLAGWWGRRWTMKEVSAMLGHSSISVTERYAHFSEDMLARAADEADGKRPLAQRRALDTRESG